MRCPRCSKHSLSSRVHPAKIPDYHATINDDGVLATGVQVYQPDPYGTGEGDIVSYTYRALRPLTAYLLKESAGPSFSILLMIMPNAAIQSTAWMWMSMNYGIIIVAMPFFQLVRVLFIAWKIGRLCARPTNLL